MNVFQFYVNTRQFLKGIQSQYIHIYIYIYIYIFIYIIYINNIYIYIYIYIYLRVVSTKQLIKSEYNKITRTLTKVPPHLSFRLRYLFQHKSVRDKKLLKPQSEYSRPSLHRHAAKSMDSQQVFDKRKFNKGRAKKYHEGVKNCFTRNTQIKRRIWVICYQEATIGFWS